MPIKPKRCPVCRKPLTEEEWEKAMGVWKARKEHLKHLEASFNERMAREENRRREKWNKHEERLKRREAQLPEKVNRAKDEGRAAERAKWAPMAAKSKKEAEYWKDRYKQLSKGSTPQTEGLEFEEKLAARLRREFTKDDIQPKGKGGDVLQIVREDAKRVGLIIYECKRTPDIPPAHVRQAQRAKEQRQADFAVLVTTGQRKGFGGFTQRDGVLVVSPLAVLHAASLLRMHLIEMWQAGITKKRRQQIADRLLHYITQPEFKEPVEDAIRRTSRLETELQDEVLDHLERWQHRRDHYQAIRWDVSHVQENVALIQRGQEPKVVARPRPAPRALPPARLFPLLLAPGPPGPTHTL